MAIASTPAKLLIHSKCFLRITNLISALLSTEITETVLNEDKNSVCNNGCNPCAILSVDFLSSTIQDEFTLQLVEVIKPYLKDPSRGASGHGPVFAMHLLGHLRSLRLYQQRIQLHSKQIRCLQPLCGEVSCCDSQVHCDSVS